RRADKWEAKKGANRFVWDLRYTAAEDFPGMVIWGGLPAPRAVPGKYQARLKVGSHEQTVDFDVRPDPRSSASLSDMEAQFQFLLSARDKLTETHRAIKRIRDVRGQIEALRKRLKDDADTKEVLDQAGTIEKQLTAIEEAL